MKIFKYICAFLLTPSIVFLNYPFLNLKAEEEYIDIPIDQVNAYRYWTLYGFDLNVINESISATQNVSFTYSGDSEVDLSTSEGQYRVSTTNGSFRNTLRCTTNTAGTSTSCKWYYYDPATGQETSQGNFTDGTMTVAAHTSTTTGTIEHKEKISGTISTTDNYKLTYHLPVLSAESTSNNSEYTQSQAIAVYPGQTVILSFMVDHNIAADPVVYYSPNSSANVTVNRLKREYSSGWYKYTFGFTYTNDVYGISNFSIRWPGLNNTYKIIPIYYGEQATMKDDLKVFCGLETDTNKLLRQLIEVTNNGTTSSQEAVNSSDQATSDLTNANTEYHNMETTFNNDMNSSLENIDLSSNKGIIRNNKFGSSSRFVVRQFNRLVTNTPFELLITYSLTVGLALLLVGKFRR